MSKVSETVAFFFRLARDDHWDRVLDAVRRGDISVNAQNDFGETLVHIAAHKQHAQALAELKCLGAALSMETYANKYRPMHYACGQPVLRAEDVLPVLALVPPLDVDHVTVTGRTPLYFAARAGSVEATAWLLQNSSGSEKDLTLTRDFVRSTCDALGLGCVPAIELLFAEAIAERGRWSSRWSPGRAVWVGAVAVAVAVVA
jgi:hypothetical protein